MQRNVASSLNSRFVASIVLGAVTAATIAAIATAATQGPGRLLQRLRRGAARSLEQHIRKAGCDTKVDSPQAVQSLADGTVIADRVFGGALSEDNIVLIVNAFMQCYNEDTIVEDMKKANAMGEAIDMTPDDFEILFSALVNDDDEKERLKSTCLFCTLLENGTNAAECSSVIIAYLDVILADDTDPILKFLLLHMLEVLTRKMTTSADELITSKNLMSRIIALLADPSTTHDLTASCAWIALMRILDNATTISPLLQTPEQLPLLTTVFNGLTNASNNMQWRKRFAQTFLRICNLASDADWLVLLPHWTRESRPHDKVVSLIKETGHVDIQSSGYSVVGLLTNAVYDLDKFEALGDEFLDVFLEHAHEIEPCVLKPSFASLVYNCDSLANRLLDSGKLHAFLNQPHVQDHPKLLGIMLAVLTSFRSRDQLIDQLQALVPAMYTHAYTHLSTPLARYGVPFLLAMDPHALSPDNKLLNALMAKVHAHVDDATADDLELEPTLLVLNDLHAYLMFDRRASTCHSLLDDPNQTFWTLVRMCALKTDVRVGPELIQVLSCIVQVIPERALPLVTDMIYSPYLSQLHTMLAETVPLVGGIVKSFRTRPDNIDHSMVEMVSQRLIDVLAVVFPLLCGLDPAVMAYLWTQREEDPASGKGKQTLQDILALCRTLLELLLVDTQGRVFSLSRLSGLLAEYVGVRETSGEMKADFSDAQEEFSQDQALSNESQLVYRFLYSSYELGVGLIHYDELRASVLNLAPAMAFNVSRFNYEALASDLAAILLQLPDHLFVKYTDLLILQYPMALSTTAPDFRPIHIPLREVLLRSIVRKPLKDKVHWASRSGNVYVGHRGNMMLNPSKVMQTARGSHGITGSRGKVGFIVRSTPEGCPCVGFTTHAGPVQANRCLFREHSDEEETYAVQFNTGFAWHNGKGRLMNEILDAPGPMTFVLDLDQGQLLARIGNKPLQLVFSGIDTQRTWYPVVFQLGNSSSEARFYTDLALGDAYVPLGLAPRDWLVAHPDAHAWANGHDGDAPAAPRVYLPLRALPQAPPPPRKPKVQFYYELDAEPAEPIVAAGYMQGVLATLWVATRGLEFVVQFIPPSGVALERSDEWNVYMPRLVAWMAAKYAHGAAGEEVVECQFPVEFEQDGDAGAWKVVQQPTDYTPTPSTMIVCGHVGDGRLLREVAATTQDGPFVPMEPWTGYSLRLGLAIVSPWSTRALEERAPSFIVTKGEQDPVQPADVFHLVQEDTTEEIYMPVVIGFKHVDMYLHMDVEEVGEWQLKGAVVRGKPAKVTRSVLSRWTAVDPSVGQVGKDEDDDGSDDDGDDESHHVEKDLALPAESLLAELTDVPAAT